MTSLPSLYVAYRILSPVMDAPEGTPPPQDSPRLPFHPFINATPAFYSGHFTLTTTGDTFLDVRKLGKGALWINGHSIGRFWNIGPQDTLYVPGPWLHQGTNEVVLFDLSPPSNTPTVAGLGTPILDGPVTDTSLTRQQE
jgi:beta-galactosidase